MSYFAPFYGPALYDYYYQMGRQSAQLLVESIQRYLHPAMQILDVGTGTGFVAFALAPLLDRGQIVGIDADENALGLAQAKAQTQGLTNLTFQTGDALQLAFADDFFDLALANQIPLDQAKVLGEMARVTRPGGLVGVVRPNSPQGQVWQFFHDIACELARQHGQKPPEKIVYTRSDPSVIQAILHQIGLEVLELTEETVIDHNFDQFVLANLAQQHLPSFVAYTLQIDPQDTLALMKGLRDFLEVGERLFNEQYNRQLKHGCLVAIGRKPG
jgi:ubiquinone/menaquinone biosynthesis C-methylase UbiE